VAGVVDLPPKILNMTVPHVGHLPLMALRPFFIVSSTASTISFLALHLTQYPSGIKFFRADASCESAVRGKVWGRSRPALTGKRTDSAKGGLQVIHYKDVAG